MMRNRGGLARALKERISQAPFFLGISSVWPGTFLAYTPDRYFINAGKAVQRTGHSLFKDASGFLHHNRTNNAGDRTRFYLFNLLLEQIDKEELEGDLAELGVYKGNTAVILAKYARMRHKTVYLFDTFKGFSTSDLRGIDSEKQGGFDDTSVAEVKSLVGNEQTKYIVGYFPDSATQTADDNASFCLVHLDCDLYSPMISGLEYFYPRIVPGGFLVLHDYSGLDWNGAERAIDEFLADKPERVIPIPDKSGTVIVRKVL